MRQKLSLREADNLKLITDTEIYDVYYSYHYIDTASANSIISSKIMYKSTDIIADARWGIGAYFTDMDPNSFSAEQICHNNWQPTLSPTIAKKLEACIAVTFPKTDNEKWCEESRRIFLHPGLYVNLNSYGHRVIDTNFNASYCQLYCK